MYGASNAVYSETAQGSKKNHSIEKSSASGTPAVNLLENSSFEGTTGWTENTAGYTATLEESHHYLGDKSYKLYSDTASGSAKLSQTVTVSEAGTYTFSAYVKLNGVAGTGVYAKLGNSVSRSYTGTTNGQIQSGWQRISVTANLQAGNNEVSVWLKDAIGTAYVDCLQLEKGSGTSSYNLLSQTGLSGTLSGTPTAQRENKQTVTVTADITTTFVLSGWAQADSVARRDGLHNFDLVATLTYSDNSTEDIAVSFSTDSTALQFTSGAIVGTKTDDNLKIKTVAVAARYDYNANDVTFSNICLAVEPAQTYGYDSDGNLTSATDAEGNQIGAEYNGVDIKSYTNIVGEAFAYEYTSDTSHILSKIIKSDGNGIELSTTYDYDDYGNVEKETVSGTNVLGSVVTQNEYDSYGRVEKTINSLGKITTYERNEATELLEYIEAANGARTAYDYDGNERLIEIFNDIDEDGVKDTNEQNVVYTYNDKDQLTSINNGGTAYTFTYDSFGNVTCIKAGNYTLASYNYSGNNGKLLSTVYGNGLTVTNVYDNLDRLVEVKYNNNRAYTISYNQSGAVSSIADALCGITTEYEYDPLGRLIYAVEYETATESIVLNKENKYDSYGRPSGSLYDLPDIDISYSVTYKENSNLVSNFQVYDYTTAEISGKLYTYDALERVTNVRTIIDGVTVYQESYTYVSDDTTENTSSLIATHTVGGVVYSYTYDNVGNILTISENNILRYSYTYDKLGQLDTAIYYSDNYYTSEYYDIYEYLYDKSGNITFANHHYGVGMAYTDTISYTYGNATWGDLLTAYNGTNITYDAIGNPVKWRNAASFVWYGRQLLQFQGLDGSVTAYGYNADGIRTSKTFYDVDSNVTGTVKYTLDGGTIVAENRNGANIYYTYDDKGAIMGMLYDEDNYIFSKNLQGDIIGIYNANRQLVAKYQYSAFGEITAITDGSGNDVSSNASHIANINPFRYRGYYYDTETGFYYLITRYYDPVVGRFINADTFVSTGQGLVGNNMFAYCLNDPSNSVDTFGAMCVPVTHRLREGVGDGPASPKFYSDGKEQSDELRDLLAYYDVPSTYNNFIVKVKYDGRVKWVIHTPKDNAKLAGEVALFIIPLSGAFFKIIEMSILGDDLYEHFVPPETPGGYYHTYTVSMSWSEEYTWDGGTTYCYFSYDFRYVWDTISRKYEFWRVVDVCDYSKSEIVEN